MISITEHAIIRSSNFTGKSVNTRVAERLAPLADNYKRDERADAPTINISDGCATA